MEYHPTIQTVIFVTIFLIVYLVALVKNTIKNSIDFYDLILLSSVAVIPSIFVFFPKLVVSLARIVGVEFPFLLLFGSLFFIVFVYLYRLVIKINQHHNRIILLIQEFSLLIEKLQKKKANVPEQKQDE
ncbi:MAG: DUF2304 domain-containing protein [Nitrospira sp.]|nr:DUF2304 domain-containing protein [Nitrospira sp.]